MASEASSSTAGAAASGCAPGHAAGQTLPVILRRGGGEDAGVASRNAARVLRTRYRLVLAAIAVALGCGVFGTQSVMTSMSSDGELVNVSGRQRMLSQRIAFQALEIAEGLKTGDAARVEDAAARLAAASEDLEAAHEALLAGSETAAGKGEIHAALTDLTPLATRLVVGARKVVDTGAAGTFAWDAERVGTLSRVIAADAEAFLPKMHAIVGQYEGVALDNAVAAARASWFSSGVGLVIVLLAAVCVFEPTARLIAVWHAELRDLVRRADAASAAKTQFLANMSHELRTPLAAIQGHAELLREDLREPDHAESAKTIERNARHLVLLIDDILDLTRSEAGEGAAVAPCSPRQLADEASAAAVLFATHDRTRLDVVIGDGVPGVVATDARRVRKILFHLASNAVKFTERGSVTIEVQFGEGELVCAVTDTGPGIPAEDLERIFLPFEQVDGSMSRRTGGPGIGLATAGLLARELGGTLSAESTVGEGSRFTARFPVGAVEGPEAEAADSGAGTHGAAVADADARGVVPSDNTAREVAADARHARVLLVEDVEINRELFAMMLGSLGMDVIQAGNGMEALDIAEREGVDAFDLILTDMQMPVMDGYTAVPRLRAMGVRCPIVAATAHAGPEDEARCRSVGCSGYIAKPFGLRDLERACAGWDLSRRAA
ncbi:MAG: ATP-binding protein [Planctomycetota bacterium]